MPRQRFQISENRFQRAGPDPTGFRFQISDPSSEQADEASPLQMSECRIQIPGTKKYRLEGPRRRPDNIGQISKENLLSPVLGQCSVSSPFVAALRRGFASHRIRPFVFEKLPSVCLSSEQTRPPTHWVFHQEIALSG